MAITSFISGASLALRLSVMMLSTLFANRAMADRPAKVLTMDFSQMPTSALWFGLGKWTMDHYIRVDRSSDSFYVFDREGHQVNTLHLDMPGIGRIQVHDFAAGPDGLVSLCGWAFSTGGHRTAFLAIQDANDGVARIVPVNPYSPELLAVAPDGTIWTSGHEMIHDTDLGPVAKRGANVLRHFRRDGNLIGCGVPWNNGGTTRWVTGFLVATNDRVALYPSANGGGGYVEVEPTTFQVTDFPRAPVKGERPTLVEGFALTPSGEAYALMRNAQPWVFALYHLDRAAKEWKTISLQGKTSEKFWRLHGNNDESLVLAQAGQKLLIVDPR